MAKGNEVYGLCSLYLIRKVHINPKEAIEAILNNVIANYAAKVDNDLNKVFNSIIYDYYNNQLSPGLDDWFEELIKVKQFNPDKGFRGFYSESFDPSFERTELIEAGQSYPSFEADCIEFYRFKEAMKALGLQGDITSIIKSANVIKQQLIKYEARFGQDATFMVKIDMLLQFMYDDKPTYEFELFAAFAGIKSIIGKKDFCSTTKAFIVMRMIGAKSQAALEEIIKSPAVKAIYDRYTKRYHFDKLIIELQKRHFISAKIGMTIGVKSRLFISCHLAYDLLPLAIAKYLQAKKQKSIEAKIKTQEQAAIEKIRQLTSY